MKNNQIEVQLSTDIKKDSSKPIGIKLMSRDINNNQFVLRFKSNGEPLSLSDGYTVEVLSHFVKAKTDTLTTATVYDNYAKWAFDTRFITQDDRVYNYVYVKKDGVPIVSADANAFYFDVGLSRIDEGAREVAKYYDGNYEQVLHEFEVAINLTKEEWAQMADETRSFVEDIKDATVDEFVALKMGEELQNIETNYATRLTGLETNDASITAQLAEKANDSQVRKKSNPITLSDFDGETLGIIQSGSGGTPITIESIPRDGSVTADKTDFLVVKRELFDENRYVSKGTISTNINENTNIIYPSSNPDAKLFYVPVTAGKSYTVKASGVRDVFSTFNLAFSNSVGLNAPIKRVYDSASDVALTSQTKTVVNTDNHEYLLIRANNVNTHMTADIRVFEGSEIPEKELTIQLYGAEMASKEDIVDGISKYKIPQKSVTPEMTNFLEVSEDLHREDRFIERATIQLAGQTNYIYPSTNQNAKLFYVPISEGETYTVGVEATRFFSVFSVALSNEVVANAPIEIINHFYEDTNGILTDVGTRTFVFNNSNNYKYLLVRADNPAYSVRPPIHVYKGSEIPTRPTSVRINNQNLALLEDLPKAEDLETSRYKTYYELPEIIKAPTPVPSHQEIYGLYDELVSNKTRYNVEMTVLGTDGQGNQVRSYKFSRPPMINDYGFERIKVGIMSGLHGDERYPVYALHQFMKDLSENEHNNEVFNRIMTNVDFYIIPIGCPTGWENKTRQNWNGVNLNRNFEAHWETTPDTDKGSSPASEEETQLIQNWMIDNELDYFTDFHVADMGVHEGAYTASWFHTDNADDVSAKKYYRTLNLVSNLYSKKYDELPNDLIYGHVKKVGSLSQSHRFAIANGITGTLLEISEYIKWFAGDIYKVGINWSAEMIGNFIIELTREHLY